MTKVVLTLNRKLKSEDAAWLGKACKKCKDGIYHSIYGAAYCYVCGNSPLRRDPSKVEFDSLRGIDRKFYGLPTKQSRSTKLSYEEVIEIKERAEAGEKARELAPVYRVTPKTIRNVIKRTSYQGRPL